MREGGREEGRGKGVWSGSIWPKSNVSKGEEKVSQTVRRIQIKK
jgi:hypothetical protein